MKAMILFLLVVRMLFLGAAGAMCIFGLTAQGEAASEVHWGWRVGYGFGLLLCGFLIGRVWQTMKVTWLEQRK